MGALGALGAARIIAAMRLVIIERDGVLCVEREGYLRSPDDWQAQPGALEAIAQLNHAGYQVAVSAIWPGLGQGQFDMATVNVNNRVKIAEPRLPDVVRQFGVTVQKRSNDILMVTTLTSPDASRTPLFLSNYALVNVVDDLKRIPGVGDAQIFGALDYSIRLWLKPDRMAQLGVTASDIANAIAAQNRQNAAVMFGDVKCVVLVKIV